MHAAALSCFSTKLKTIKNIIVNMFMITYSTQGPNNNLYLHVDLQFQVFAGKQLPGKEGGGGANKRPYGQFIKTNLK